MAITSSYKLPIDFKSGSDLATVTKNLQGLIESSANPEVKAYYKFCLIKTLEAYNKFLMERLGFDKEGLNEFEETLKSLEDLKFTCVINGEEVTLATKTKAEYSFDKDVLKSKSYKLSDGTTVKDMTAYVKYLKEQDLPIPNFINESVKTICSFDKKIAESFESDELVKKELKKEIKF